MSAAPQKIDRYELVDRLGEGGMGTLYLARDPALGRTVAIKLLSVHSPELRERFEREARAAAALKHHNIVTIYDVGEEQGQPFIAMEFVAGETLAEVVSRRAPLSPTQKLELLEELCDGLGYAHRAGIVHRDIKPANVMVSAEGELKILDFGLARVIAGPTQPELTRAGVMIGTPHYMSPEQIEGRPIDHRSDIFSVGLVIYELLSYQKAYPGDSPYGVVHRILTSDPEPLDRVCPGLDPALTAIVERAIQKDPSKRYQDLASLGGDLERVRLRLARTASEPTLVVPLSSPSEGSRDPATPTPSPRPLSRESLSRRRAQEIQKQVDAALVHLAAGRFEQAIDACEAAALIDQDDPRVLSVLQQAQDGLVGRQLASLLAEAQDALERGTLSQADMLLAQAAELRPNAAEVLTLRQDLDKARMERERVTERARAMRAALDRATGSFEQGALESALRSVSEALAHDPLSQAARQLKQTVLEAIEARRRDEELERNALECVAEARQLFGRGEYDQAIGALEAFTPAHPVVERAREDLLVERDVLVRRARETEELQRRRTEEEERKRADVERLAREAEEDARLRAAEQERQRREQEEREQRRVAGLRKGEALAALEAHRYDEALAALAAARSAWAGDPDLALLEQRAHAGLAEADAAEQRRLAIEQTVTAAEAARAAGDLERARRLIDTALEADPASTRALSLQTAIDRTIAARRQQQELDARAQEAVTAARRRFDEGQAVDAIDELARFAPPHPVVTATLSALREQLEANERARLQRERAEEAARQARADADARRRDEARRQRATELAASARRQLAGGDLAAARAEAAEALLLWPAFGEAIAVRDLVERAVRDKREREQHEAAANAAIDEAQRLMAEGRSDDAVRRLERFRPAHEAVSAALAQLRGSVAASRPPAAPVDIPSPVRPRVRGPVLAAAAAIASLIAVSTGGWWWWTHRQAEPGGPPSKTTTTAPAQTEGEAAIAEAKQLRREGHVREALVALRRVAPTEQTRAVISDLYADATREAETAAREAEAGGAMGAGFEQAQQVLERARTAGRTDQGVAAMLEARDAFKTALANAAAPDAVVARARQAFEKGQLEEALSLAASVEQREPGNGSLQALTSDMRTAEQRRALEQRRNAEHAGASREAAFVEAARRADNASRSAGLAGVRAWHDAAESFAAVAIAARRAASVYGTLDDLVRRGNDTAALTEAERLLARSPADARVLDAIGTLRQRARSAAVAARSAAQAAGSGSEWPPAMAEGAREEGRAQAAGVSPSDSVRAWWTARQRYEQAARTAREAGRAADQIAALFQRGQYDQAAAQLGAALKSYPGFGRLDAVMGSAFDAAVREAEAEAAKARRGNAAATPAFKSAAADEMQARRAGRSVEGVRLFHKAADGYRQAAATIGPTPPVQPPAGGQVTPPAGGQVTPVQTLDAMRPEIESVLAAIARAYSTKDITEINRLLRDTMEYEQLRQIERNFKEYKSVRWSLRLGRLERQADGTVRVTCTQIREIDLKAGHDISDSRTTVFTMRKTGDEWRVLSQTYP